MKSPEQAVGVSHDPEYIEKKIELIEKGLPVDIAEEELQELERTLRGARSFYIDILVALRERKGAGEDVEANFIEESENLAGVEIALRDIDNFRSSHWNQIKNAA